MTGSFGTCFDFFSVVSSMSKLARCRSQVNFTSTNTFPSETQGKPLKIKATLSPKNTEGASLTLLYSAKPFGICTLLVCEPIPRLIFPLPPWKQNESSAITKKREESKWGGFVINIYLLAWGICAICGFQKSYEASEWFISAELAATFVNCQPRNILWFIHIWLIHINIHGIFKSYYHWNRLLDQN